MKPSIPYHLKAIFYFFMTSVFLFLFFYAFTGNALRAFLMVVLLSLIGYTVARSNENSRLATHLDVEDKLKDREKNDRTA